MRILYALAILDAFFLNADAKAIGYPLSTEGANITCTDVMHQVLEKLGANDTLVNSKPKAGEELAHLVAVTSKNDIVACARPSFVCAKV